MNHLRGYDLYSLGALDLNDPLPSPRFSSDEGMFTGELMFQAKKWEYT